MLAPWAPGLWLLGLWATFSHGTNIGELTQTCLWLPELLEFMYIHGQVSLSYVCLYGQV